MGVKRNVKPELAEAKGKRLLIAAETEEGMRLSTSIAKQMASTDLLYAEKKYKAPFAFAPSHTLVLYTNHLPRVGAMDVGIWRRLIVIPFEAKIEGSSDIKNYAEHLYQNAAGAVLQWIVDGARKVIDDDFVLKPPPKVRRALEAYRFENDWMTTITARSTRASHNPRASFIASIAPTRSAWANTPDPRPISIQPWNNSDSADAAQRTHAMWTDYA